MSIGKKLIAAWAVLVLSVALLAASIRILNGAIEYTGLGYCNSAQEVTNIDSRNSHADNSESDNPREARTEKTEGYPGPPNMRPKPLHLGNHDGCY